MIDILGIDLRAFHIDSQLILIPVGRWDWLKHIGNNLILIGWLLGDSLIRHVALELLLHVSYPGELSEHLL
jgi:hypothetical protein